jgi:site-specific DNA-methyltransferase (adenine-specific)
VFDCRQINLEREQARIITIKTEENNLPEDLVDKVLEGDCLKRLRQIPDNSIDFAFADPPYNLGKKYHGYSDDLKIKEYFK